MRRALFAVLIAPLALAGCGEGVARHRIEAALEQRGIAQGPARCMADRLVDRLSIAQLRKLEAVKAHAGDPVAAVLALQAIDDPEVVRVTITAAGLCLGGLDR